MPGILAVQGPRATSSIRGLEAALYKSPYAIVETLTDGDLELAVVGEPDAVGCLTERGVTVAFEGHFLKPALAGDAASRWLIDRFLADGDDFARGLSGSFQLLVHHRGRTLLYADSTASRRLFYACEDGWLACAPEVAPLARLLRDRAMDPANAVQFLLAGRFFAGQTLLRAVRQLLPGECLEWGGRGLRRRQYDEYLVAAEDADEEVLTRKLEGAIDDAIASQLQRFKASAVLLTGGYDSRYILHGVLRHVPPAELITISWGVDLDQSGRDGAVAANLARSLGVRHVTLERHPEQVVAWFGKMLAAESGMTELSFNHAEELDLMCRIREDLGVNAIFRGDECFGPGGHQEHDALAGGSRLTREDAMLLATETRIARARPPWFLEEPEEPWAEHSARVASLLASQPADPEDVRDTLWCTERLPAFMHHLNYYKRHYVEVLMPLLARDVLAIVRRMPAELRREKRLFKRSYKRRYGDHMQFPFTKRGNAIDWAAALRTSDAIFELVRTALLRVGAPLNVSYFIEQLDDWRRGHAEGRADPLVSPDRLAIRAMILGHWLEHS